MLTASKVIPVSWTQARVFWNTVKLVSVPAYSPYLLVLSQVADHGKAAMKLAEHWEQEAKRQAAFVVAAGSAELEAELQELRARVITLSKDMIALESTVDHPYNWLML